MKLRSFLGGGEIPRDLPERPRLLLHLCCAPDGTIPWPELVREGYDVTGHFCGSNLHPEEEYGLRLGAVRHLADSLGGTLLIDPYRPWDWMEAVRGTEREPEGGERCSLCFAFQFEAAARAALERGCRLLCTTLTISPHKDPARINRIGGIVAERFGLTWLPRIFRKGEGFRRSVEESHRLGLYRQDYCGCVYSRREKKT